jgi:hypothetical protein
MILGFWVFLAATTAISHHYSYEVPSLLYNPESPGASSNISFLKFSSDEQRKEVERLAILQKAAEKVAGVYPPFMTAKKGTMDFSSPPLFIFNSSFPGSSYYETHMRRTVVVTVANMGYLSHLRNFECFARRLHLHFLILAVDDSLVQALQEEMQSGAHQYFQVVRYSGRLTDTSTPIVVPSSESMQAAAGFQSAAFNLISLRKFEAVYDLQRLGFDVLFVDADVVVLQDVFHVLLRPALAEVAYMHSMNHLCSTDKEDLGYLQKSQAQPIDGNTGFHFFQFPASVTMQSLSPILSTVGSMDDDAARIRKLLLVTESLPTVQLLHEFLRYIPHNEQFNPGGQFDDQTLFWRFLRSLRATNNPNLPSGSPRKSLLTTRSIGLCSKPGSGTKKSTAKSDNTEAATPAFQLCALNACQFSAGAFMYHRNLLHHAAKRLDYSPYARIRLPEAAYALLRNQPARGDLTQLDSSTSTHRLLPRHQLYTRHLMFDYLSPFPRFYFPSGVSQHSYLYSMHGNYITGDVDKQQLVKDAGYWLVHMNSKHDQTDVASKFRCLQFPHDAVVASKGDNAKLVSTSLPTG